MFCVLAVSSQNYWYFCLLSQSISRIIHKSWGSFCVNLLNGSVFFWGGITEYGLLVEEEKSS